MQHFITTADLSLPATKAIIAQAQAMQRAPQNFTSVGRHQQLATLFFEPSTRTRLSFTAAMQALGGQVLGFESIDSTSVTKGESLADTIRVVSQYVDAIVVRHPTAGAAAVAATHASVPVINAGDGDHLHPTQTLTDLATIDRYKHRLNHLTIAFGGDLKYGRTVHSLVQALMQYPHNRFIFVAPTPLQIPNTLLTQLQTAGIDFQLCDSFDSIDEHLDVLYMTRQQTERVPQSVAATVKLVPLTLACDRLLASDTLLLHPLPRGSELPTSFDHLPQAHYFDQVRMGKYVRMALLAYLLPPVPAAAHHDKLVKLRY
ncbi:aspartate carbamoyltransferase [Lactiplantibacillus fabifermentans]|uniref:Aspartate carbamoyltransferase n=2 Tax=Lactiplantibacillus fabifermentans TaxID=483011 RepID=A0A0R2NFG5_9LACO|nr:aspartate carbamoyltransferase [Lactiplantibacillus fabifermentans]ETY73596.1 aspartate carbamoyltransferase [Lactiplantibacillus fabifermentans T30PCM01]KRO24108.1 aspartate carbamoyltransferase [Lactiplantibacillus fabifermentans DSM 21115]